MGRPKLLMSFQGQPMIRHVAQTVCAVRLAQVVVVVGAHARAMTQALNGLPLAIATNAAWSSGMSSSIYAGLQALAPDVEAAIIVLADQPAVTSATIQALVRAYLDTQALVVAPTYRGRRGNPVLFDRALFGELAALTGDKGARDLITRHRQAVVLAEVDHAGVVQDIDTLQDYRDATVTG